jgi:hypothetical protein
LAATGVRADSSCRLVSAASSCCMLSHLPPFDAVNRTLERAGSACAAMFIELPARPAPKTLRPR